MALACAGAATLYAQANRCDILITGAKVVNGSGSPWFYGDVGIRGDTIAAVGSIPQAEAGVRIDARGMVVAPGFIDIHSHGRRGINAVPTAENYLREGVTTFLEERAKQESTFAGTVSVCRKRFRFLTILTRARSRTTNPIPRSSGWSRSVWVRLAVYSWLSTPGVAKTSASFPRVPPSRMNAQRTRQNHERPLRFQQGQAGQDCYT